MRRIQRDVAHEELIKYLTSGDQPIFRDIWRVLLFAAAYGVKKRVRIALKNTESNKAIPDNYFNTPGWKGFLYLLGFLENGSSDHLKNNEIEQNKLILAFEEYANFGLIELSKITTSTKDPLGDIVSFTIENSRAEMVPLDLNDLSIASDNQL